MDQKLNYHKMNLSLNKTDLINLIKGIDPYYSVHEKPLLKRCGYYIGGFHDKWIWQESELKKLSEGELIELYTICKNSLPKHS